MKLILVDDHKIVREGIKALLANEQDIDIVGEANNGKELIQMMASLKPDVILLDANMPEMDGLEVLEYFKGNNLPMNVLILSMAESEAMIKRFIDAGAKGYILKTSGKEELLVALKSVHAGKTYLSTDIAMKLLTRLNSNVVEEVSKIHATSAISKRELEVLELISEGYTNAEIADKLFTSKRTIESHRRNLIEKTKTKNTAELIRYALSRGLIHFNYAV